MQRFGSSAPQRSRLPGLAPPSPRLHGRVHRWLQGRLHGRVRRRLHGRVPGVAQGLARLFAVVLVLLAAAAGAGRASPNPTVVAELTVFAGEQVWLLEIPHAGPWSHWAMGSPSRLVIDLANARSALSRAPGLFAHDFGEGPVRTLRTSQFSNQPQNRTVRVTLELRESGRYEATQRDGVIRIRMSAPEGTSWGEALVLRIDGDGAHVSGAGPDASAPGQGAPGTSAPGTSAPEQGAPGTSAPVPAALGEADAGRPVEAIAGAPPLDEQLSEAGLDSLLADSTLFEVSPLTSRRTAWELAAARLLEEAQQFYVAGDSTASLERFETCERFYADTDAGMQAAIALSLVLRLLGREVEATLAADPASDGHWPLLTDELLALLFDQAYRAENPPLAAQVLEVWRNASPAPAAWAREALRLAEYYLEEQQVSLASQWVAAALEAHPELEISPRALFLHASTRMEAGAWEEADPLLARLESIATGTLRFRTLALRADCRYRTGRYREAAERYEALLAPEVPTVEREWACYQLGNCWMQLGEPQRAIAAFTEVAGEDSESFWAPFARMRLADLKGDARVAVRP